MKIKPDIYSRFCQRWVDRLTDKFPKGANVTKKNLEWVYDFDYAMFDSRILSLLSALGKTHLFSKWDYYVYCQFDDKQYKTALIKLAYRVLTENKLTKKMMKECGL